MSMTVAVSVALISLFSFAYYSQFLQYCYFYDDKPYKLYSSKTSYEEIRGKDESPVHLRGCAPILFYYLSRHGTRYPSSVDVELMQNRLPKLRNLIVESSKGKLCDEDLRALSDWKLSFNPLCRDLTREGELEQTRIALRFMKRFPNFLSDERTRYDVRYMSGSRIIASLESFLKGLRKSRKTFEPRNDDEMLFFDQSCPKWSRNQNLTFDRADKVMERRVNGLRKKIAERLGFARDISSDDVNTMYNGCRYEIAWFPHTKSPWCAIFDSDDLKLLEFVKDIEFYVKYGYESRINYEQACPIVRDIVENIESVANDSRPAVVIRFSHSGAMVKFFTRLGLFNDSVASIVDFDEEKARKRKWRTSLIDPFSSNLCLVLFKCGQTFRVLSYLQENEISLPVHCSRPCPLETLLNYYKPISDSCNANEICEKF